MTTHKLAQLLLSKECKDITLSEEHFVDLNDDKGMLYLQFTIVDNYKAMEDMQYLMIEEQEQLKKIALEDEWYHNQVSEQDHAGPKCHWCDAESVTNNSIEVAGGEIISVPTCSEHNREV